MLFVKPIWLAMTGGGHSHDKDKHAEAAAIVDDNYSAVDATKFEKTVIIASNTADKFNIRSNIVASVGD